MACLRFRTRGATIREATMKTGAASTDVLLPVALERARGLSPVMFVAMVSWMLVIALTERVPPVLIALNILSCSITAGVAIASRSARFARAGHVLCNLLWCAPIVSTLAAAWLTPAPLFTTLLSLETIGAVVLLDTRWVVATTTVVQLIWIVMCLRRPGDAATMICTLATAQAFAIAMQIVLRRAMVRQTETAAALELQLAERTRLEAQLFHAQRMEAVGTLAAGLAHDMNNVLASISSFASLLDDEVTSTRGRADLDQIMMQSLRGAELTRGLLAFSRRGQYRKQTIRIDDIVLEVLPILERTLPREVEIKDKLDGRKLCVDGDPTQLGQALVNIGINAADAMKGRGSLTISTVALELAGESASTLALAPGRYARIELTDDGPGMDEAVKGRVFEPFFTTKPAGQGTGLGLSAVWGIVHAHQGAVTVDSTPSKGTTFTIYLPIVDAETPSRKLPVIARTTRLQRVGTVLVIDDEPAVRAGTARILERMGLTTILAVHGAEGLELHKAHASAIDLVILDMGMPVMGGAECFRKLRETSNVPVLIATGFAVDEDVQDLVARGASLIEKPYAANALIAEVARLLEPAKLTG
jgi:signal transduction histidine kinase